MYGSNSTRNTVFYAVKDNEAVCVLSSYSDGDLNGEMPILENSVVWLSYPQSITGDLFVWYDEGFEYLLIGAERFTDSKTEEYVRTVMEPDEFVRENSDIFVVGKKFICLTADRFGDTFVVVDNVLCPWKESNHMNIGASISGHTSHNVLKDFTFEDIDSRLN